MMRPVVSLLLTNTWLRRIIYAYTHDCREGKNPKKLAIIRKYHRSAMNFLTRELLESLITKLILISEQNKITDNSHKVLELSKYEFLPIFSTNYFRSRSHCNLIHLLMKLVHW